MLYLVLSEFIIFFVCSLINVILSTIKSIVTARANKLSATLMNAISYGFYTIIVKQLADVSIPVAVGVTIVTNLIGVYASCWFMERIKKERLWVINVTTKEESVLQDLEEYHIKYTDSLVHYKDREYHNIHIFAETHNHSLIVKQILDNHKAKYHIEEISKNF